MNDSCIFHIEDANIECEGNPVPEVSVNVDLYGENISWIRKSTSSKLARSTIQPRDICRKAEQMANDDNIELPILIYFGANRGLFWRTDTGYFAIRYMVSGFDMDSYGDCIKNGGIKSSKKGLYYRDERRSVD